MWPRCLSAAEEWVLWRRSRRTAAAGDTVFFDDGTLAAALQRASELAADYRIALSRRARRAPRRALLHEAQRRFAARCRELNAADVGALAARLPAGEALAPAARAAARLRGHHPAPGGADRRPVHPRHAAAPATPALVRPQDTQAELEAIAAWCRRRLEAQPDARLLVMLPGGAGVRERLATLVRGGARSGAGPAPAGRVRARWSASRAGRRSPSSHWRRRRCAVLRCSRGSVRDRSRADVAHGAAVGAPARPRSAPRSRCSSSSAA